MPKFLLPLLAAALLQFPLGAAPGKVHDTVENVLTSFAREKLPEFSKADIRVEVLDDYGKMAEWEGKSTEFRVGRTLAHFRPVGIVIFPVEAFWGAQQKDTFFVKASVSVYENIVTSTRSIARGEKIQVDNIQVGARDVALLPATFFTDARQVLGKEARMTIPPGRVFLSWMVRDEPVIHKSALITLLTRIGAVRAQASGVALEDGSIGDSIRVKNRNSARVLQGKVLGPSLVEIEVP